MEDCWTAEDRARVLAAITDELWRYVGRHARDVPAATGLVSNLTGLSETALETLRHLHLLLSTEVALFVDEALPELLGRRRAATERRVVAGHGPVRGPVAWGATAAARARTGGGDRSLYAATTVHKHLDTPEIEVAIVVLKGLARTSALLRSRVAPSVDLGWGQRAAHVAAAVDAALAQIGVVEAMDVPSERHLLGTTASSWHTVAAGGAATAGHTASDPSRLGAAGASVAPATLDTCARSSRVALRQVADAYVRYRSLVETPTAEALLRALEQRALAPLDDDLLYELWAVLGTVAVLDDAGWRLRRAGLVGQDATPFTYVGRDNRTTLRLHIQHTPREWRGHSHYRALFERYGLPGATRRPDLIVEARRGRGNRYLLVEVKRTRNGGYIADSIYKVLGYLADFATIFQERQGAQGLLLLWDTPDTPDTDTPTADRMDAPDTLAGKRIAEDQPGTAAGWPATGSRTPMRVRRKGAVRPVDEPMSDPSASNVGLNRDAEGFDALVLATHRTYRAELRTLLDQLIAGL